jgi:hypothetical protein
MDDRFVNGFLSGMIAVLITGPMALAAKHFNLIDMQFPDFAGILALGRIPETLAEQLFGYAVDVMISGALGIIFAYLVPFIGSRYLLFKGWFYAGAVWFLFYPTVTVLFLEKATMNVQTALINALLAGLFGLVLAKSFYCLHTRT